MWHRLSIRCTPDLPMDGFQVWIFERNNDGLHVADPVTIRRVEQEGVTFPPTLQLSSNAAQTLLDDLWVAGLRPTDYHDTRGEVTAMRAHIADLQRIVFRSGTGNGERGHGA